MKLSALVIDDEKLARKRIKELLVDLPEIDFLGECSNGKKAIEQINQLQPDMIFLDIQMKDMTGFDVLNTITTPQKPHVIFITAFDEYALKGFEYFAFDYLLKPFSDERFYDSINKLKGYFLKTNREQLETKLENLLEYIENPIKLDKKKTIDKLPVKLGNKVFFINIKNIKYIMASGYYAEIYTEKKEYLLRESLSNLVERLGSSNFIRIHRSTIINIEFMNELVHSNFSEVDAKMNDGKLFRISKSYKKELFSKLGL